MPRTSVSTFTYIIAHLADIREPAHNKYMSLEDRIERLYAQSEHELDTCALPNGALVAANSDLPIYPSTAENYRFSWARDAAYQLLAAYAIDPDKAAERAINYAGWLNNIQGFAKTGLYLKRYGTNGALDVRYGEHYQPDQAGVLIGSLNTVVPEPNDRIDSAIQKMADGLVGKWDGHSLGTTQDLWENRETTKRDDDVFTYSIASVIHGLDHAIRRIQDADTSSWKRARNEMATMLDRVDTRFYLRKTYANPAHFDSDNTLDASLAGLAYPFENTNKRTGTTIAAISDELYRPGLGVYRYKEDTYDGIVRRGSREATAGAWPLLTFWESIALHKIGATDEARDMFYDTVERLDREYRRGLLPQDIIPEQLYPDDERQGKGVLPLAWSHAKFVLAVKTLQILQ